MEREAGSREVTLTWRVDGPPDEGMWPGDGTSWPGGYDPDIERDDRENAPDDPSADDPSTLDEDAKEKP